MFWFGNGAEPSRCTSTDSDAGSADGSRRSDDRTGSGCACYDYNPADGNDAADFDDWSANADHDEGRWTGSEYYTGSSGSGDECGNDANG